MVNTSISDLRLQLISRGYHILPNRGKIPALTGWNTAEYLTRELAPVTPKGTLAGRIGRWTRRWPDALTTGLRIEDGLIAIDIDVDDESVVDGLMRWLAAHAPEVGLRAPTRYGGGTHKLALFARADFGDRAFIRLASRKYSGHQIEVFGGQKLSGDRCSRQFGIYGPHSYAEDGSIAAEYAWAETQPALHEIDRSDLPAITRAQIAGLIDAFEAMAQDAGWTADTAPDTDAGGVIYDITEATRFDTNRGETGIDYAGLCEAWAVYGNGLRCSSNFIPGRGDSGRTDHCLVGDGNRFGMVGVWVFGDETLHLPIESKPGADAEKLAEQLRGLKDNPDEDEPPRPVDDASLPDKAAWLIQTYSYFAAEDAIVQSYATALDCRFKPAAFDRLYRAWQIPNPDKRFKRPVFATDLWEASSYRQDIAGVRMRPDQPFPLYLENGQAFKNSYRRPVRPAGGTTLPFMTFLERFIPDPIEREWWLDWMAHKQMRPDIPGTSVFFVADTEEGIREGRFGTGRGLNARILHLLYGEAYTRSQSFAMLDGSNSQSTFNDWLHGCVLVTVDESKSSPTAYRRGERHAAYEVLKELVDPAPKRHTFRGKHRQAFDGMSYCSIVVATNHSDAMAIPENDRRFTVLCNGREILPEEARAIVAWTDEAANIGALSRMLAARDLAGFNMLEPLPTASKAEMAELARSDVEELLRDIMDDPTRGLVFTKGHIEMAIEHNYNGRGAYWQGEFRAAWHAYCVGLKMLSGGPKRIRVGGTQRKLFCFRDRKRRVDALPEAAIRREVMKWGSVDPLRGLHETDGLSEKDE